MRLNQPYVRSAVNLLRVVREQTDAIGVAVSFGKDSLATLDLCCELFDRVEGYYLFRVRDLEIVQRWSEAVKQRWGVAVRPYPHFDIVRCYRNAIFQPHWKMPQATAVRMTDIENQFRRDANLEWLAMGWRRNDSFSRAIILKQNGGLDGRAHRVFPIRSWRRKDVYDYLAARKIPLPDGLGRKDQGGLDFHPEALRRLRDNHPADWQRWQRDFPLSGVQLCQTDPGDRDKESVRQSESGRGEPSTTARKRTGQAKHRTARSPQPRRTPV
jgi:Phosphoadenosine phosphosulfate reductase family